MLRLRLPLPACIFAFLATAAYGEVPNMPKEVLQNRATHIVIGEVKKIYAHEAKDDQWVKTAGVVELAVTQVEKGERIEPKDLVYAKFWTQRWIGTGAMPTGSNGHRLPKNAAQVRAYLQWKDGGYVIVFPNGLEPVPADEASAAKR